MFRFELIDLHRRQPGEIPQHLARVLADAMAAVADRAGCHRQFGHDVGDGHGAQIVVRDFGEHAARGVMRVGEDVGHRVYARGRHFGGMHKLLGFGASVLHSPARDDVVDRILMFDPREGGGKTRVGRQCGLADRFGDAPEYGIACRSDVKILLVRGRIEVVRRIAGQPRAGAHRDRAQFFERRHVRLHETESAFVKRRVDDLSFAGLVACFEGQHGAERRIEAGDVVGGGGRNAAGRPVGVASNVAYAADRFADHAVAGALAVRTGLAVAADADHDQAGIQFRQFVVTQPPRFERTGTKILDQEVAFRRDGFYQLLAARFAQVHCN